MVTSDDAFVRDLVTWWATRQLPLRDGVLADEFQYESEFDTADLQDFVSTVTVQEPWERVDLLVVLVDTRHAIVIFEGTDPVADVVHRIGWFVEHSNGLIRKITEVDWCRVVT
jgi:hypothetical protein